MKKTFASLAAFAFTLALPVAVPTAPAMAANLMDCWHMEGDARTDCIAAVTDEIACNANGGTGPSCPDAEEARAPTATFVTQTGSVQAERSSRCPAR